MKKRILACVLTMTLILMLLVGCISGKASTKTSDMFEYIGYSSETSSEIVYDTETKVMYAISEVAYNRGTMTLLVDENGKPKLWEE
ncbi:DUF6440 family protein [Ruminococcus bromii]|uniref:DUF6440 family protein n=1 Tax=Ruminococcus bromii TaxID=40518 RepID=UPI003FD77846